MLMPNSILFISCFESICLCWGFAPSIDLFLTFFYIRSTNGFSYFGPRVRLSIFTGYKDSIKSWIENYTIVELKESFKVE